MKQVNLFALGQGLVRGCFITLIVWVTFFFFFCGYWLAMYSYYQVFGLSVMMKPFLAEVEWNGYRQKKGYTHEAF